MGSVGVKTETPPIISFRTDRKARQRWENRIFGKRILSTNRVEWTTAEVVAAYRSQFEVKSGFRRLEDPRLSKHSTSVNRTVNTGTASDLARHGLGRGGVAERG